MAEMEMDGDRMVNCPSCGASNKGIKKCLICGCYLPPLLEEKDDHDSLYLTLQFAHTQSRCRIDYPCTVEFMDVDGTKRLEYTRDINGRIVRYHNV